MSEFSVQLEPGDVDSRTIIVTLTGSANITNVSELLMHLLAAFDQADNVMLDMHGVTEIDAAGLQLLCSSHRNSIYLGKKFKLTGNNQPVIREAAAASGLLRTSGCAIDSEHTCIWMAGTC